MDQATALSQIRAAIDDGASPPSKSVRNENLRRSVVGDQVNGTNKFFQLNNKRIVEPTAATTTLVVISDGTTLVPVTAFTDDPIRGTFTLAAGTTAPATTLLARYDFTYFLDSELTPFLTQGLRFVGLADITTVADALADAVIQQAAGKAFTALASRYAPVYDSAAGTKRLSKASIKKHWLDLAKDAFANADAMLKNYYQRQGQRDAPAFGSFATKQTPFTPRR